MTYEESIKKNWIAKLNKIEDYEERQEVIQEMSDDLPYPDFQEVCGIIRND